MADSGMAEREWTVEILVATVRTEDGDLLCWQKDSGQRVGAWLLLREERHTRRGRRRACGLREWHTAMSG